MPSSSEALTTAPSRPTAREDASGRSHENQLADRMGSFRDALARAGSFHDCRSSP